MTAVSAQRKAILGGVVALTGSLAVGLIDNALTAGEAATALAAGVAAYASVYGIRNDGSDAGEPPALDPGALAGDTTSQDG